MSGHDADVIVIGGGPAGLGAAAMLRRLGVGQVMVLEREAEAGGIPRHCGHPPFGMREFRRILSGPTYARRLVSTADAAGVTLRTRHSVTAIHPGGRVDITSPAGTASLQARRILLATGTRESTRAQRLIPGLRPLGVMNTAALQAFVYLEARKPFARPVIVGSELVSLSALLTCLRHGIRPVAMVETDPVARTRRAFLGLPRLLGVPLFSGAEILSIEGTTRVEGLRLRRRDGRTLTLGCDGLVFSGRFTPEAALARSGGLRIDTGTCGPEIDSDGRSSDPHVFVAGNVLHPVETAGYCWAEGERTARALAKDLAHDAAQQAGPRVMAGPGLRYVVPQRLGVATPAQLNLRVEGRARGRLTLSDADGRALLTHRIATAPEQPVRLPLTGLDRGIGGDLHLRLDPED